MSQQLPSTPKGKPLPCARETRRAAWVVGSPGTVLGLRGLGTYSVCCQATHGTEPRAATAVLSHAPSGARAGCSVLWLGPARRCESAPCSLRG